jgi:hypothetical protein
MPRLSPHLRARAAAVFKAHAAGEITPHCVTGWRDWLFAAPTGGGLWWSVPKADPTADPRPHLCSLAQAKANLRAGY